MIEEDNLIKRINEIPFNATLLKLIHHELGNGLAVLSGYRSLLQRSISAQAHADAPPDREGWRHRNEQWLGYLRIMHDREKLLDDFLAQLRALSPGMSLDRLCQNFVQEDLVVLLDHVIERLAPLYPDRTLRVHFPVQSLSFNCDPFWINVVLEHIFRHTIAAHSASSPIDITLELSGRHVSHAVQEARIAIRIQRELSESHPAHEGLGGMWSQVLGQGDGELCSSMCSEVLQEHGGRAWKEKGQGQEEIACLALPL